MKVKTLNLQTSHHLTAKMSEKPDQFSNDGLLNSRLQMTQASAQEAPVSNQMTCPHTDKKTYAKNMCHSCYQNKGKSKMASSCGHTTKPHYSNGMCQSCYLAQYYLKRKAKNMAKKANQEQSQGHKSDKSDKNDQSEPKEDQSNTKHQKTV